ncbi:1,6-anhydro-N-acetylmuramyl-L-alanine amidase AmpD [Stenotrophobium rhamnosiphilum]|uniref:1,6-anhydro-N-acetylmuramyl-L-alanine amidase AmpD n=1 Tax=Stenotrophobium rhamnosiphilum TaxID=2029166 RepID=A0A2T5MGC0_9GAMM|nr:1,6-anhydro-N-acetylmuramyl-L-alanine amidase AmpD [Stenotrophobium rhamnosiphilum]PTU31612.1 1,6-anhydro-N-acetylmuramyl-L-alanine amidase AmpD [Stenotrophobium rhamnosiphilum]
MTAQTLKAARGSATPASVDSRTGRLQRARWLPSPNFDERPDGSGISLLVIHNISLPPDQFGGGWIDDLFLNRLDFDAHPYFDGLRELKVSPHCCIFRDGRLTQYVSFNQRAWHAGKSQFEGRERCNDFSIGIELEGCDTKPFTKAQYQRLLRVTRALQVAYPAITAGRIVGHSDIAPGRKTDPGPHFDWTYFKDELGR